MFSNNTIDTKTVPIIVTKQIIPLPNNELKFDVFTPFAFDTIREAVKGNKYIAVFVPKDNSSNDETNFNVNPYGVVGKVVYHIDGNPSKVKIIGVVRCRICEIVQKQPVVLGTVTTIPSESGNTAEEINYIKILTAELNTYGNKIFTNSNELANVISEKSNADAFTDVLAYSLKLDYKDKIKYLNSNNITIRLRYLIEDLKKMKQLFELNAKIDNDVAQIINENQKEYYLREKMKVIQNELGDKAKKETEIEELKEKILKAKMPKDIEEKALNELSRYQFINASSGESNVVRSYLDFIISLPWYKESDDNKDIKIARDQLDSDHYGLEKVKERILEYLAVKVMTNKNPQAILCLVGPPGVGKTSLASSIAAALNKKFIQQSLGGVKDEAEIRGHRRTYLAALPGRILQGMKRAGVINPVFLLDEIDKLCSDYKGDPSSALLEVLDAEQNKHFSDHYLEEPYDLSKVFFITTANYLENIPEALRDRMEVVQLSSYTEFEKFEIAKRHLIDKQLFAHGISKTLFELTDEAIFKIIRDYTKEAGVRDLERIIGTLIRKAIKTVLIELKNKIVIDSDNLEKWLGKPKFLYNKIDIEPQIGVVTGLAYTQYGGDTLPVEVTYYKGTGRIVLTGKLGDVMKESAQAALSYVKSNADRLEIDANIFSENDIHIHVPEGAVPKDGPSAGVTMVTAIVSAFAHKFVNNKVGMTGEITLRGRVLPIGGLREKAIAAHRSGLQKIVIPKDNQRDIDEIPESVRKELEISFAETIDEVLNNVLL